MTEAAAATPAPAATPAVPAAQPAPAAAPVPNGAQPATPPADPPRAPWFQQRIDAVTREKWEATRRAEAAETRATTAEAELSRLRSGAQPATSAPATPAAPTAGMVPQTEVERLAREYAERQAFNARCDEVYHQGMKEVTGFKQALDNFAVFGGLQAHPTFLQAVTRLPDAAHVLAHLGSNMEEANRILSIPDPIGQAVAVAQISATLRKPGAVSNAPAPLQPTTGGVANPEPGPDNDGKFTSHAAFLAWRNRKK